VIEASDLQGGILRGYGFPVACHLFARVCEAPTARAFLAGLADPVTTEEEWDERPATTLNVALSFRALRELALPESILGGFAPEFRAGMAAREKPLGDDADDFDRELRELEVLLVIYAATSDALAAEVARWRGALAAPDSGLELTHVQPAGLLEGRREHFGFADGFSQPAIEGGPREGIRGQGVPYRRWPRLPWFRVRWRAVKPGEFITGYDDEDGGLAPAPPAPFDRNASFMVWRKLRQDVAGFRAALREQAQRLALSEEFVAAKLVGRWRDGSPLVLRPEAPDRRLGYDKARANDFHYGDDADGSRCPRGAHIRRANPRDALGWEGRLTARHRILRRGMPYGEPLRADAADDGADRGLLFICLQASIARQFEIVQSQWCNDGNAFRLGHEPDPIMAPPGRELRHVIEGDPPRFVTLSRPYIACRGGEYLVVPGLRALRALPTL
jgi:Dyp-type peroxidase family